MRYELRLAGSGGQGLVLAGIMLAEAGQMEGHMVVHSQNYGPEARGGNSVSEVIFSDEEIDYPRTMGLDMLVAFNQKACNESINEMKESGLVIVDSAPVKKCLWGKVLRLHLQREADVTFNDPRVVNVFALGVLTPFCDWVSEGSMTKAISNRLPAHLLEHNMEAFKLGFSKGTHLKETTLHHELEGAIDV
ncbi:MAG: 2-oxoacid:acceptor oxidoreductase family protein [Dehalococcoidia bacterium]|nr:2-oxoacid:acceptor oxidoreductase family protein [Dehalococcoidia bacterium]